MTLTQLLQSYNLYGFIAFAITAAATPLAIRVARRTGVMDMPDQVLKPHARPTPYLGGVAIALGWSAALLAALLAGAVAASLLAPILVGGLCMGFIGLVDDARGLTARTRLALEATVVAAVMLSTGVGLRLVEHIGYQIGLMTGGANPADAFGFIAPALSLVIGVFIVLGAINSLNLIDGLDGLCTGVTGVIALAFFALAAHLAVWGYSVDGDPLRLVIAIALLGATLGFLPFNYNPARIFMGDAGSVLLGFCCGILILLFAERGIFRWMLGALMIFALPAFDTTLAIFRRWRSGKPLFKGDRSHFYDQLVQRGLSVRQTVGVCYLLAVAFGGIGLLTVFLRTRWVVLLYLAVCAVVAVSAYALRLTHPDHGETRQSESASGRPAAD